MADPIKTYPEDVDVTLTIPLIDENGDPITATAINYRVIDSDGNELIALAPVSNFNAGDTEAEVTVDRSVNILPTQPVITPGQSTPDRVALRMLRAVELQVTTAAGIQIIKSYYVVAAKLGLQVMVNSFQTYENALLFRTLMPALDGWDNAADTDRQAALTEAFFRLQKIGYRIKMSGWGDSPPAGYSLSMPFLEGDWVISPRLWPVMQPSWWVRYPQHFREAMYRAQIVEADVILNGDVIAERREDGLMSETIGQSSMMFRPGKPLMLPVSRQAAKYLENYIEWRLTITRG